MKRDAQQLHITAQAQADALARWKASKRALRTAQHRRRMEGKSDKLSQLAPAWLAAVERDDRTDPAERELQEA